MDIPGGGCWHAQPVGHDQSRPGQCGRLSGHGHTLPDLRLFRRQTGWRLWRADDVGEHQNFAPDLRLQQRALGRSGCGQTQLLLRLRLAGRACTIGNTPAEGQHPGQTDDLKEFLVPLRPDTPYRHRQKLALNGARQRTWVASTTAPSTSDGNLSCGNTAGELCELVGITLSDPFGAIGYSWRVYSTGVTTRPGHSGSGTRSVTSRSRKRRKAVM